MMMLFDDPLQPCANCKRYAGYTRKRGRSKRWVRICKHCNLKYDVLIKEKPCPKRKASPERAT